MSNSRDYAKLTEMRNKIDKFVDSYEDMSAEEYDMWNYKVTVMMQEWCDEYNKKNDGKFAKVVDRTIILN